MKQLKIVTVSLLSATLLLAGQGQGHHKGQKGDKAYKKAVKIGNKASKKLLKTLGGNLKKHMKAGGPADALAFCAANAADLTAKVDRELGKKVTIKRITLKPRNPANEAKGEEKAILKALETLNYNGVKLPKHLVQKTASGYRYYKPLVIKKQVCLKCHGPNIAPKLKAVIDKHYPTDKARGYKMGDLRGAIVVDIQK
ncbi:MAG: DUF3365 domain-containing protein [Epsilonproteobacteria bacterium]|nr:DUF3365 domain-containing protein [Campylobacterota bacterium]